MLQKSFKPFRYFSALSVLLVLAHNGAFVIGSKKQRQPMPQKSQSEVIRTEEQYLTLLKAADEETFKQEFEAEFLLLLDDQLKKQYARARTLEACKSFIEYYWKAQNPNPLLPENDRLKDHLRRRLYARKHFPIDKPPYFDDRGKYHIKYGKPFFRFRDFGGPRSMLGLVTIPFNYYTVKPNESWSYVNVAPNYVVHFAEKDRAFREIESLREVIVDARRRGRLVWYWGDLLKRRFWMSSLVNNAVTELEDLETQILVANRGGAPVVRSSNRIVDQMFRHLKQAEYEMSLAHIDVPPVTYDPIRAKNKLPFTDTIAQFRGPQDQTRVEVVVLSPLRHYVNRKNPIEIETIHIEFSSMLREQNLNPIASERLQRKFPAKLAVIEDLPNAVGMMTLLAYPQEVEFALQVTNERNGKIGFSEKPIHLRDFGGRNLMLSDLQFFVQVTNANQQQVLPVVEKRNINVAPYPFKSVSKSRPLYCYFEIYNLHSANFDNEYEITYKVMKDRGRENIFEKVSKSLLGSKDVSLSISYVQRIIDDTGKELIELDLSNLTKGAYILEISVSDTKDKKIGVSAQKEFNISE
ncbi:MAG: GWxTD domain-containing protein [bacterium]